MRTNPYTEDQSEPIEIKGFTYLDEASEHTSTQIHVVYQQRKAIAPQRFSFVWEGDSLDWKDLSADEITRRVTSKVQPGSIVLFHNAAKNTPEALPGIVETLLKEGYSPVPISQILLSGEYTIDHTGRQCPASVAPSP